MDEEEMERSEMERRRFEEMAIFSPRESLARTPPNAFSTPVSTPPPPTQQGAKRHLPSPDETQEAIRRRGPMMTMTAAKRSAVSTAPPPPLALEPHAPAAVAPEPCAPVMGSSNAQLVELATTSTAGIMEAVRARTSKLNKDEIAAIGGLVNSVSSVVTHLVARLAAAEQRAAVAEERARCLGTSAPMASAGDSLVRPRSYTDAIKRGRGSVPVPIPAPRGPAVAVFPAEDQKETLRTSEETKKALQAHMNPVSLGIRVQAVRKTGGAGLMVQTASETDAKTFRAALPPTLRVAEARERRPLIALVGVDGNIGPEELLQHLQEQNLKETAWATLEEARKAIRPVFNRSRRNNRRMWVCECAADLRRHLIERGKAYIGWDVVEVNDHVDVTCCRRCQMFGHPEKYCRAKGMTCGRCGEDGHKKDECKAAQAKCATCVKLGRKGAADHGTNHRECPARRHAEERLITATRYE